MSSCGDARTDLDAVVHDLLRAGQLLARADPELWSSPAARAYRNRLDALRHRVAQLGRTAQDARAPVAAALAGVPAPGQMMPGPVLLPTPVPSQ